jgi:hypothetical protein
MDIFDRAFLTKNTQDNLNRILELSSFTKSLSFAPEFIALRVNTSSTGNNIDSFVISTSSNPTDQLIYTSQTDVVDLNVRDGGYF